MAKRIIISLPEELLIELDDFCIKHNYNRSECIRHAVRELIESKVENV